MVHYRGGRASIDESVYPDLEPFWADLTAAYAEQVRRVAELGCTYLQLDDTSLAYLNDPDQRAMVAAQGGDPDHLHEQYVANVNAAIAGRPDRLRVTTHMCRGNFRSSWAAEGGYDFVAEVLFGQLDVDGFFLEYDDERSGGFAPLRFVRPGKQVVLGLVTTKRGELEDKDALKRRIDEAWRYVPLEQLCLSPQCGFSSTVEGNVLTRTSRSGPSWLVVETAEEVWGGASWDFSTASRGRARSSRTARGPTAGRHVRRRRAGHRARGRRWAGPTPPTWPRPPMQPRRRNASGPRCRTRNAPPCCAEPAHCGPNTPKRSAVERARGRRVPGMAGFAVHVAEECYEASSLPGRRYGELLPSEQPRLSMARRCRSESSAVISPFNVPIILGIRSVAPRWRWATR